MRTCVQVSVAMDAKDLRTEPALSERNNDSSKYSQSGGIAVHCDRSKSYQDIGSNSLPKVEVQSSRPCAVIGPDRVVPPPGPNESFTKKGPPESWPCMDNSYHTRRPPEYPHKLASFQNPSRNISPRQTFQENMQRIMVPPSYNSVKICDDTNYTQMSERSNVLPKNIKINVPSEAKFCDVPYTVFPPNSEQKNVRNPDMCLPHVNPNVSRTAPHGWPSVNVRPSRTYGAPDLYQYQDYSSCAGPRPVVPRPNRTGPEESGYVYADPFYHQEGNIRFKPYPTVKERFPQQRYDYVSNYANSFHPQPTFPSHKYELQKPVPPHPYPPYPPIKYVDRVSESVVDGYQRNQQGTYNLPYSNQLIHPNFGPVVGSCPQNKIHSYPPDGHIKTIGPNKIPYENAKGYIEYENGRPKIYPQSESYVVNEMGRMHPMKNQVIMPNYQSLNMHNIPPNQYYKKDNQPIKNYEYIQAHLRSFDPNINMHNPMARHLPVFSPTALAISPTDSSASNDTSQTLGTPQEDCGYVSQSSTASVRSIDSTMNRMPNEYMRRYYDSRFGPIIRTSTMISKSELTTTNSSKEKKNIDVRQFLQMWNEGDEETEENTPKGIIQTGPKCDGNFTKTHEVISQANQEQLYVLGLVNVPSEELGKYEHIQKVSKLPENIKGYNHIELLNQFEEAIESSNITNYKTPKDFQMVSKIAPLSKGTCALPTRPLSPLDVEAKISQSVIHKEVGCNFEIKPCSPKMLNVEVATPIQNILSERVIEKVPNPVMLKSPRLNGVDENIDCKIMKRNDRRITNEEIRIPSCKMVNTKFSTNSNIDTIKNSYSLQDLESNSGLCLASLPRLDNDIELNFPEVNQQFINANKRDSICLATSPKDLPTLDVMEPDSQRKDNLKSPCVADSEKEFLKLSKYRKTRPLSSIPKENIQAVRTDSVIIKNPENIKNYEEQSILSPNPVKKQVNDIQQAPINLTSQGNIADNANNISYFNKQHDTNIEKQSSIGIAIDFSLKNICNEDGECMDVNIEKETETLLHNNAETTNSKLDEPLSKISNYSSSQQNNHNDCGNHDKVDENIHDSEIYSKTQTVRGTNLIEDSLLEETFSNNEYVSSVPSVNKAKEDYLSPVTCVKDTNVDNSNTLLPIDFDTPPVDLLRTTDSNNGDYLMDIDKNIENSITHLGNSETPATTFEIEDLKNHNDHAPGNFVTYSKDPKIINTESTNEESDAKIEDAKDFNSLCEFSRTTNSDTKHLDLAKAEIETNNILKLEVTDENITSNFDLPSLSSSSSADNYHSETIDEEPHSNFDLSSTNSVVEQSSRRHYISQTAKQEVIADIDNSSSNIYNVNTVFLEKTERKTSGPTESVERNFFSNFNIPSPNQIVISKEDDRLETTEGANDCNFNMATLTDTDMDSPISSITMEEKTVSNLNLSSNDTYQSDPRRSHTGSNLTDMPSLNETFNDKNSELNKMEGGTEYLLKEMLDDVKTALNTSCEDSLARNTEINVTNKCTFELNVEEVHRNIRYLSYGAKEMYSPTIQKLIMFREGSTCNTSIHFVNQVHSTFPLSEADMDQVRVLDDIGKGNESIAQHRNYNSENSKSRVNLTSEVVNSDDTSVTDKRHEYEVHQNKCDNSEDINITKSGISYKTEPLLNQEESKSPEDCIDCIENKTETFLNQEESKSPEDCIDKNSCGIDDTCTSPINIDNSDKLGTCSNVDRILLSSPLEIHELLDKQSNLNVEITEQGSVNDGDEVKTEQLEKKNKTIDEIPDQLQKNIKYMDEPSDCDEDVSFRDKLDIRNKEAPKEWEVQPNWNHEMSEHQDRKTNRSDTVHQQTVNPSICSNEVLSHCYEEPGCKNIILEPCERSEEQQLNCVDEVSKVYDRPEDGDSEALDQLDEQSNCNNIKVEQSTTNKNNKLSCSKLQSAEHIFLNKNRQPLKRSLSDSALNIYNSNESSQPENEERVHFIWPFKRRKMNSVANDVLAQNLCNIIQSNRRNSISSIYNEENVSFCILIDNSCIISEEENDEQEKICYTELSEECLAEVQNDCMKDDENADIIPEILSTSEREENHCEYSDSYVLEGDDGKLEESWVEDVACVETVITDDIAEDIEISGPPSPKDDDIFSDNDESGVFSSTEHTDKVKYIYGDKMCNDDAQFVETLYNTPQMDVNKTLIQRESLMSEEYYDNDSLEKILSESTDQEQTPYLPAYSGPIFSPEIINDRQIVHNKENMDYKTKSHIENIDNAVDVVDSDILKIDEENETLNDFNKTQDDTVHSCESSIDNVFTYKENDDRYISSSSPEVSSTTSEEKNSAILLKITNYKGSRISQINKTTRDNKSPSCKFTEDKGYVQSHANFPTHRPLLTKAAQKYIPPLKESIRDLKVKLSLPQHSLIKLKQLKKSKDEPKVCKQSISVPKISMKPKPKFEDVLKSIDEIQFKMHKEKTKKSKKSIPKVVIKKNENGSHYASTSNKNEFNPDLTGRKWQPWVFIEKNHFIDKMAIKKKTKAVYSHRKRTYVLAEKFHKYKSVHSATKFVISPPLSDCPSAGLKYTIRLKHSY